MFETWEWLVIIGFMVITNCVCNHYDRKKIKEDIIRQVRRIRIAMDELRGRAEGQDSVVADVTLLYAWREWLLSIEED